MKTEMDGLILQFLFWLEWWYQSIYWRGTELLRWNNRVGRFWRQTCQLHYLPLDENNSSETQFHSIYYFSVPGMLSRRNLCRGIIEVKRESTRTKRNSSIPNTIKSINLSYTFSLNRWSPRHAKTKRSQGNHRCTQMQTPPRSSTTVSSRTGLVYVTGDPSERSPTRHKWCTPSRHWL